MPQCIILCFDIFAVGEISKSCFKPKIPYIKRKPEEIFRFLCQPPTIEWYAWRLNKLKINISSFNYIPIYKYQSLVLLCLRYNSFVQDRHRANLIILLSNRHLQLFNYFYCIKTLHNYNLLIVLSFHKKFQFR